MKAIMVTARKLLICALLLVGCGPAMDADELGTILFTVPDVPTSGQSKHDSAQRGTGEAVRQEKVEATDKAPPPDAPSGEQAEGRPGPATESSKSAEPAGKALEPETGS